MKSREKVFRRGGVVLRGDKAHLRADHTTTVNRNAARNVGPGGEHEYPTALKAATHGLTDEEPQPQRKPLKPLSQLTANAYDLVQILTKKRTFRHRDGTGVVIYDDVMTGWLHTRKIQRVGPGAKISTAENQGSIQNLNCSRLNLEGAEFSPRRLSNLNATEANLDNSVFEAVYVEDASFRGASLRGARVRRQTLSGRIDFRDADLEGAEFEKVFYGDDGTTVDFRGSNITSEQYDTFIAGLTKRTFNGVPAPDPYRVVIDEYSLDGACETLDMAPDTAKVLIWAGDLEVRDRDSKKRVDPSEFNPELHFIPQWDVQRLRGHNGEAA